LEERRQCVRRLVWVFAAGVVLALGAALQPHESTPAAGLATRLGNLDVRATAYWGALLILVPAAAWLLHPRCPLTGRAWQAAWVILLLVDSWLLAWPRVAVRSETDIFAPPASVQALIRSRQESGPNRWRVLDRGLPECPSSGPLGIALPMFGSVQVEPLLGYNSFDVRRYKEYLQFIMDEDRPIRPRDGVMGYPIVADFPIRNKPLLDLLGCRYLIQPEGSQLYAEEKGEPQTCAQWQCVGPIDARPRAYSFLAGGVQDLPPFAVYENRDAFPRAFSVGRAIPQVDREHILEQLKEVDYRRQVILEGLVEPAAMLPAGEGSEFRSARLCAYGPNQVVVEVERTTPGYLVLTDTWYPGWMTTLDGTTAELYRANYLFRAVAVPAGKHEVVFTFAPTGYRVGRSISLAALTAVLVLVGCVLCFPKRERISLSKHVHALSLEASQL
jgi:hypothetical protein